MAKVTFIQTAGGEDVSIFAAAGENLLELARRANVAIDAPCSGNGVCGKCRVRLAAGSLQSQPSRHLAQEEYNAGWRLACTSVVQNTDVTVEVPDIASAYRGRLKVTDLSTPQEQAVFDALRAAADAAGLAANCPIEVFVLALEPPSLEDTLPDAQRLESALLAATGAQRVVLPFALLQALPGTLRQNGFALRAFGHRHGGSFVVNALLPATDEKPPCGLAVDIGTTTVSALLVNLQNGDILARASTGNGQIRYGADVINRIMEQGKPGGIQKLQQAVVQETLNPLVQQLCQATGAAPAHICMATIAGNTTMNHLLLGINAETVRTEPFVPCFGPAGGSIKAGDIGLALPAHTPLLLAPNVGSYVGGDITAGAFASMLWQQQAMTLFIDLGTNGELVFGNGEFMLTCACSAGPAFEGGEISCGMRATDGAVEACTLDAETMEPALSVIGGGKPLGICGSGLIDLISELFRCGIISPKGRFIREGSRVLQDEHGTGRYVLAFAPDSEAGREVSLSEVDIDNFIRAKAAIFSAIVTMVEAAGFTVPDIEKVLVAGGIGSGINMKSAVSIGMFPDIELARFSYIGNSSLNGAWAMLTSAAVREKVENIARGMTYLELSNTPGYMDAFVAACFLPHTDASLFPNAAH